MLFRKWIKKIESSKLVNWRILKNSLLGNRPFFGNILMNVLNCGQSLRSAISITLVPNKTYVLPSPCWATLHISQGANANSYVARPSSQPRVVASNSTVASFSSRSLPLTILTQIPYFLPQNFNGVGGHSNSPSSRQWCRSSPWWSPSSASSPSPSRCRSRCRSPAPRTSCVSAGIRANIITL